MTFNKAIRMLEIFKKRRLETKRNFRNSNNLQSIEISVIMQNYDLEIEALEFAIMQLRILGNARNVK